MAEIKVNLRRRIQEKLKGLITAGGAPGFQLALGFRDRSLGIFCAGIADPRLKIPVNPKTWFDLASLTKVVATTSLCIKAVQKGELDLDAPLQKYFPQWKSDLRHRLIRDLLSHRSGLPAIFENIQDFQSRDEKVRFFLQAIDNNYPEDPKLTTLYSDVDFMLLGILLEQIFHKRLKQIQTVTGDLAYGPIHFPGEYFRSQLGRLLKLKSVAPILSSRTSKKWTSGEVFDPRAQWLEGDAGHAGLFGTALGVEKWGKEIFLAYHGKSAELSDKVTRKFIDFETAPAVEDSSFLLGFDRPSGTSSQAGKLFSRQSTIGHLGYTGTSFWMDIEKGYRVTLLSHRFAPDIDPEKLRTLRPGFHDWLISEVFSKLIIQVGDG